jgi:hypothetical protein
VTTEADAITAQLEVSEAEAAELDGVADQLIAQELANAEIVDDPSPWNRAERVGSGDAPDGVVAVQSAITGNNYRLVYHVETGSPSRVHFNMLPAQLKKKLPGSSKRAFTTTDPGFRPKVGSMICWLHEDHENRVIADSMGLPTCKKSNIPSSYEVELHMRHRHQQEFRAFDQLTQTREREEDRQIQRETLAAMQRLGGATEADIAPVAVAEEPAVVVPEPTTSSEASTTTVVAFTKPCGKCGEIIEADTQAKLNGQLGAHTRKTHPKKKRS